MNQNDLMLLREQILRDITPLVLETADMGAERFSLLLRLIQAGSANGEVYKKAYDNAKSIEDKEEQLGALMSLLDEIDFDMQEANESDTSEVQKSQPDERPRGTEDQGVAEPPAETPQY